MAARTGCPLIFCAGSWLVKMRSQSSRSKLPLLVLRVAQMRLVQTRRRRKKLRRRKSLMTGTWRMRKATRETRRRQKGKTLMIQMSSSSERLKRQEKCPQLSSMGLLLQMRMKAISLKRMRMV